MIVLFPKFGFAYEEAQLAYLCDLSHAYGYGEVKQLDFLGGRQISRRLDGGQYSHPVIYHKPARKHNGIYEHIYHLYGSFYNYHAQFHRLSSPYLLNRILSLTSKIYTLPLRWACHNQHKSFYMSVFGLARKTCRILFAYCIPYENIVTQNLHLIKEITKEANYGTKQVAI